MTQAFNLSQLGNTINSSGQVSLTAGVTGTLPVANGGTNSTATPTNGGVGYGTGTAHAYTAAGTSGYILQSTGAAAPVWAAPSGGGYQYALFSSGGTWTCPAGVTRVKVSIFGGGGGSAGPDDGFGGAGGLGWNYFTVTPGTGYAVTIGAGGAGGTSGVAGGTSSLGSLISATGGGGGGGAVDGANGSCANNLTGSFAGIIQSNRPTAAADILGFLGRPNRAGVSTTALVWSNSIGFIPGSPGTEAAGTGGGGVGGAILIEYIG